MNPMDLKRGIDKAVTALVEELKKSIKATTTSKKSHKSVRSLRTATKPLARSLLMRWTKSAKRDHR
jgi:chaperonin GroEL (HSP60 family)